MKSSTLLLWLGLAAALSAGEEAPRAAGPTAQSLVLKLQKTGPAEATYKITSAGREIAQMTFTYAHPTLRVTTSNAAGQSEIWIDGQDVWSRSTPGAPLIHLDYRTPQKMLAALEPVLKPAFQKAADKKPAGVKRSLEDAWEANAAEVSRIGAVVDIFQTLPEPGKPEAADAVPYVHIDPNPQCPFGWFTFAEKVSTAADGIVAIERRQRAALVEALTGWTLRLEWRSEGQVVAMMERTGFRTLEGYVKDDILPPAWERKVAVEEDAVRKSVLARIAAMPLWMYVKEISDAAGDAVTDEAAAGVAQLAYLYYAALLDGILGKDFVIESAAVLGEDVAGRVDDLKKPPDGLTVEQGKQISDKMDEVLKELLNLLGRRLAAEGFTGVDFLDQLAGRVPPANSLDSLVRAALEGFTRAYNDRLGMPIHGMVRWRFRRYWLEPLLREQQKAAAASGTAQ